MILNDFKAKPLRHRVLIFVVGGVGHIYIYIYIYNQISNNFGKNTKLQECYFLAGVLCRSDMS